MNALFFLLGASLPFATVGPEISSRFYLNPSILLGVLLGFIGLIALGMTARAFAAALMLLFFAATAVGHPFSSYALSISAFAVVLLPVVMPLPNPERTHALLRGYVYGLVFTLIFMWLEITLQVIGLGAVRDAISTLFTDPSQLYRASNYFAFYYRPYATFSEPAHLGIFLAMSIAILDQMTSPFSRRLKKIAAVSVFFTGSLVGLFVAGTYLAAKLMSGNFPARLGGIRINRGRVITLGVVVIVALIAAPAVVEMTGGGDLLLSLLDRFDRLRIALLTGAQSGSEGSRANAILLLGRYWQDTGISGFLFGEGYGNYSAWLVENFGHLGQFSTAARGQIDNMLVAVFISTGLFGFIPYLAFIATLIRPAPPGRRLLVFMMILILQFGSGFLLFYLNWQLPFVLMVATRMNYPKFLQEN